MWIIRNKQTKEILRRSSTPITTDKSTPVGLDSNLEVMEIVEGQTPLFDPFYEKVQYSSVEEDGKIRKTYTVASDDLPIVKQKLIGLIKKTAYEKETGGLTVNNTALATDRDTQNMIGNALTFLTLNPSDSVDWQNVDNTFTKLNKDEVERIAIIVGSHVQACFTRRKELMQLVNEMSIEDAPTLKEKIQQFWE